MDVHNDMIPLLEDVILAVEAALGGLRVVKQIASGGLTPEQWEEIQKYLCEQTTF